MNASIKLHPFALITSNWEISRAALIVDFCNGFEVFEKNGVSGSDVSPGGRGLIKSRGSLGGNGRTILFDCSTREPNMNVTLFQPLHWRQR